MSNVIDRRDSKAYFTRIAISHHTLRFAETMLSDSLAG